MCIRDRTHCESESSGFFPSSLGTPGGTFTSSPTGLNINLATGKITPLGSSDGTYTVEYTTPGVCSTTSSASIIIIEVDDASFSYPESFYCESTSGIVSPTANHIGGTFTSSPSGLSIDSSSGEIDTNLSAVATYTIEYTSSGISPGTASFTLTINDF